MEEPIQVRENQEIAGIASLYKYLLILYETLECIWEMAYNIHLEVDLIILICSMMLPKNLHRGLYYSNFSSKIWLEDECLIFIKCQIIS